MYASFLQRVEHARNTMNALQGSTLQSSDRGGMHIEYYPPFLIFVPIFINSHSTNLKLKNRIFWFLFQICTVQNEEALKTLLYKLEGNRYQAALTCISLTLRHLKEHHGMLNIVELKSLTIYVYVAIDDVRIQFQGWFSFCICKISFYDMLVCNFRFALFGAMIFSPTNQKTFMYSTPLITELGIKFISQLWLQKSLYYHRYSQGKNS